MVHECCAYLFRANRALLTMLQGAFDNCQLPRMLPLLKNGKPVNNVRLDVLVFSRLKNFNVFIINIDERLDPNSFWIDFGNFHPQNYDCCVAQCAIGFVRGQQGCAKNGFSITALVFDKPYGRAEESRR